MNNIKISKKLNGYLRWPLYLSVLLLCMNFVIYCIDKEAGIVMTIFLALYIFIAVGLFFARKPVITSALIDYASSYSQVQRHLMRELVLPYAVMDADGNLMWGNDEFLNILELDKVNGRHVMELFPEITQEVIPEDMIDKVVHTTWEDRAYKVVLRRILVDSFAGKEKNGESVSSEDNTLVAMYLQDETEMNEYIQQIDDQKMIVGLLYIDNYDEALDNVDEVRASLLLALIDRKVNKYMQTMDAIVKKLEKDKYVFIFF